MPTLDLLATLSAHAYGAPNGPVLPAGVTQVKTFNNPLTGFKAAAYLEASTSTLILSFAGTEKGDRQDWENNKAIALGFMPVQRQDAQAAFNDVVGSIPANAIVVTGHSLGGGLAQMVVNAAVASGLPISGVTFGAPGMAAIASGAGERMPANMQNHLTNYVTPTDPIAHWGPHIGGTISIHSLPSQLIPFSITYPGGAWGWILRQHPMRIYLEYFHRLFNAASPVIVDLDGDGVETRSAANGVFFDHENDGFAQPTGWVGADDALLVRDLNGNGQIDSGRELFGSHTLLPSGAEAGDGFRALAALDGNGDGRLDGADAAWPQLRLWQDSNSDGVVQAGELRTLDSAGITAVATTGSTSAEVDANGHAHALTGSVTHSNGTAGATADVWFQQDLMESVATQYVPVPPDVAGLPDVQGHGTVRDLHQAIVRDGSGQLRAALAAFVGAATPAQRKTALETLLYRWTGAEAIAPGSRGPLIDARQLRVLEQFLGEPYVGVTGPDPHHISAPVLIRGYERVFEMVYASLVSQTSLAGLYGLVTYTWDDSIGEVRGDFSAVEAELAARIAADPAAGNAALGEFARTLHGLGAEGGRAFWRFRHEMGELGAQHLTAIDSWLKTVVTGTAAGETLGGTAGDDLIDGGAGNDTLAGAGGADAYVLRRGIGQDTINDLSPSDNRIVVAPDVLPADVRLQRSGDHLVLTIAGTSDQLTVLYWFGAEVYVNGSYQWVKYQIEEVGFGADGTVWSLETIKQKLLEGTAGNDTLTGYEESADAILGLAGDDQIAGRDGDDTLDGGSGADALSGDAGADTLRGGPGADVLAGGAGKDTLDGGAENDSLDGQADDDTYLFGRGTGQDTVLDLAPAGSGGVDRVVVAPDVTPAQLTVQRSGTDLVLGIAGMPDQLLVRGWFGESFYGGGWYVNQYQVERIEFLSDGTVWDIAALKQKAIQGSAGNDTLIGYDEADDTILGLDGADLVSGRAGNDTLDGGPGADSLDGELGDDTLRGGSGNDTLQGSAGRDLLDGGPSDDILDGQGDNDTYLLGRGAGADTAWDLEPAGTGAGGTDRVLVAADVTPAEVTVQRSGTSLVLGIAGTADQLTLEYWFGDSYYAGGWNFNQYQIERVEFLSGATAWDIAALKQRAIQGTAGNDALTGYDESGDSIAGLGGNDQIAGRGGNDTLDGGSGTDGLNGEQGDDTLLGGADADTLLGGAGNDTLDGGAGGDSLDGQADNDTYVFGRGAGQDTVWDLAAAGAGGTDRVRVAAGVAPAEMTAQRSGTDLVLAVAGTADQLLIRGWFGESFYAGGWYFNQYQIERVEFADGTVWDVAALLQMTQGTQGTQGTSGPDTLIGSPAADILRGLGGDDVLQGGDGDDLLDGGPGADSMSGQAGNDTYLVDVAGDVVTEPAGQGTDEVQSTITYALPANVEKLTLTGAAPVDGIGNALGNALTGNGAANRLDGGAGADTLAGAGGDDTYVVDSAGDVVVESAASGIDTVLSSVTYGLPANVENLTLTGSAAVNATGNGLDNALAGNPGANVLTGGAGDDTYVVGAGDTVVETAGEGTDTVQSAVTYTLPANVERLVLTGNAAINGTGNALNNRLTGNAAANTLAGGAGDDVYAVDSAGDSVSEGAGQGTDTIESSVSYTLPANVEVLVLTGASAINGTGNGLANALYGNAAGNALDGGNGADTMTGGPGDDSYVVDQAGDAIVEQAGEGVDRVQSSVSYALPANVESLTLTGNAPINATGNGLDNVLTGNGKPNTLTGGAGNDTYVVQDTGDVVVEGAAAGTDAVQSSVTYTLPANVENLTLTGAASINGTGNGLGNVLAGNRSANVLTGGAGNDVYAFEPGGGQDVIVDIDAAPGNSDVARFGAGVGPLDLVIKRVGNDLVLSVHDSADSVAVRDWYLGADHQVETIQAGDGRRLLSSQVQLLVQDMASFGTSTGLTWDQAIDQRPGDVELILAGRWQP